MWKYGNKKPLDLKKEEKEKFLKYKRIFPRRRNFKISIENNIKWVIQLPSNPITQ